MAIIGRCGNYENRPDFCKKYPTLFDMIPDGCAFHFVGEERHGKCRPDLCQENNCCSWPREGGEPEGRSLDEKVGGRECKHLVWIDDDDEEKVADLDEPPCINDELYTELLKGLHGEDDVR